MGRDKERDDKLFNCSQEHERNYIASLYDDSKRQAVLDFISHGCSTNIIYHTTHYKVYKLIEQHLELPVPPAH